MRDEQFIIKRIPLPDRDRLMPGEQNERLKRLKAKLKRLEGDLDVRIGNVCDEFGGCANCRDVIVAHEVDERGEPTGATVLFLCTHSCHKADQA